MTHAPKEASATAFLGTLNGGLQLWGSITTFVVELSLVLLSDE
jgi:hypothetical protein